MEKGFLGIEIGEQTLRFVYVVKQKGEFVLLRAKQIEANLNFTNVGALTQAIKNIIVAEDLKPERIFVTISRRDTLVHQQYLPHMSASELEVVVPAEIEKVPFFYNQAFEYCYKAFTHTREKDRVILAAVSADYLKSMIEEVDALKILFRDIEISPLNLKEVLPAPTSAERCEAVLVVQEQSSYFCIYKNNQYLGLYRSPLGTNQLLSPVTFDNKEQMMANWISEFERVIKSHLGENMSSPVSHIWVVADKLIAEDVAAKFNKFLEIPTEVFPAEKLNQLKVPVHIEWNPVFLPVLTPVMIHLRDIKPAFPLDHFFANFRIKKYFMQMALKTSVFILALWLGMGTMNHLIKNNIAFIKDDTQTIEKTMVALKKQNKELFAQRSEYEQMRLTLLSQAGYVQELNRTSWTYVLAAIANELPEQLTLTGFNVAENGHVQIKGETFDITNIAEMIRKIDESSILESGKFEFLKEKKEKEAKLFNFGIQANLKGMKKEEADNGKN